jgi:hypothetical protein
MKKRKNVVEKVENDYLTSTLFNSKVDEPLILIEFNKNSIFYDRSIEEILNIFKSLSESLKGDRKEDFDCFCVIVEDLGCIVEKDEYGVNGIMFDFDELETSLEWYDILTSMFTLYSVRNEEMNKNLGIE